jgi:hypothetical protein
VRVVVHVRSGTFLFGLKRNKFESTLGTLNYLVFPMKLMGFHALRHDVMKDKCCVQKKF